MVKVVGEKILFVALLDELQAKIEPDEVRIVGVDDFNQLPDPAIEELLVRQRVRRVTLAVEPGVARIGDVVARVPRRKVKPVFRVMERGEKFHALRLDGF